MNVFDFWELFCQYLMPDSMSEMELNRLIPVKLKVFD